MFSSYFIIAGILVVVVSCKYCFFKYIYSSTGKHKATPVHTSPHTHTWCRPRQNVPRP